VSTLSAGERAVVANMAPEYGAPTGYFPIDARTLDYLRVTGRTEAHCALVERYAKAQGLWFDAAERPAYTQVVELDLASVETSLAGPRRPQDRLSPADVPAALAALPAPQRAAPNLPRHPVAIAAITSCTNTSEPRLLVAAGLLARKARRLGLTVPAWVKTSFAPGSPTTTRYLERAGLLADLEALGFAIVGYGCTTCIGNSGRLVPSMEAALARGETLPVAVLSGNRNFPGRVHPQIEAGFLASPPLVVAYALAGDAARDISRDPLGISADGQPVHLGDIWPSGAEIDAALADCSDSADFRIAYDAAAASGAWATLDAPATVRFPWDKRSTYIRRPPFADAGQAVRLGHYCAHPLLVLGDDITTDHISPAGQIPPRSPAGAWLIEHGEDPASLNVYASRRGNWEVMLRGLFANRSVANLLRDGIPPGSTVHAPSGEVLPLWLAAERYRAAGLSTVILAGERYGMGSSRDWAAKGLALLGIRAVLAASFEQIHRSNLIGMGILPLQLAKGDEPEKLGLAPGALVEIDAAPDMIAPHAPVAVTVRYASGRSRPMRTSAAIHTALECATLREGGVIPALLKRLSEDTRRPDTSYPRGARTFAASG
jgi:aconitate hydratase